MHLLEDGPSSYTSIGIVIAISGNVLISLALNIQKRAHRQVQQQQKAASPSSSRTTPTLSRQPSQNNTNENENENHYDLSDTRPLLPTSTSSQALPTYGATKPKSKSLFSAFRKDSLRSSEPSAAENGTIEHDQDDDELDEASQGTETDYLYSKLWWFGFLLMNIGELGNFLSYAYAPASLVAPLGTVALVANCFFAPLLLGERFRKRDFVGIILAIIGSVTVVLSSKPTDTRLDKTGLIHAISQPIFIGYTILNIVAILFLTILSQGNAGREWIYIDVGICALYGGYTVLATKGLSTLLSLKLIQVYKLWITYPLVAVLLGTGIGQIRYLNRALMKFDSKHVIPTQFVMFNLTAIIGSAILYRDFEDITLHKMISFIYGILTVFLAIFILTYVPTTPTAGGTHPLVTLDDPISAITSPISPTTTHEALPDMHTAVNINGNKYILRTKASTANLGISPGQYLLLATSPPTDREADFGSTRRRPRSYAQDNERSRSRSREGRRRTIHFENNNAPR